ncbi:YraN family protein [Parabacteroides sp. Marseille-P3160]|uniref:YraN family protein n=1 Tax=Parabacteroides sp. Marseille-P3160 TaxID=1917887 RepID=UPI0009BA6C50|nr:YraN family protein [Parabacteroides sp. Marseille-P3160]
MAARNQTGKEGERRAQAYLTARGYTLLHMNWRWHRYELDIVATDGRELVVVEVKTRSSDFLLAPEEAVDREKIRRIVCAADAYVRQFHISLPIRFDVIALVKEGEDFRLEHLKDAFYAPTH